MKSLKCLVGELVGMVSQVTPKLLSQRSAKTLL